LELGRLAARITYHLARPQVAALLALAVAVAVKHVPIPRDIGLLGREIPIPRDIGWY